MMLKKYRLPTVTETVKEERPDPTRLLTTDQTPSEPEPSIPPERPGGDKTDWGAL